MFLQFVRFGIVGISTTIMSYAVYTFFVYIGFPYLIANAVGFVVGTVNSFVWNSLFVFKKKDGECRNSIFVLSKTFIAYGVVSLALSSFLLMLFIESLCFSKYVAPIMVLIITVPLNFFINKFWVYKGKEMRENKGLGLKHYISKDVFFIFVIIIFLLLVNYVCLGFYLNGLDAPCFYGGGDDFSLFRIVKTIIDEGWNVPNPYIGVPFCLNAYDFPAESLMNFELLCFRFFSMFSKSPFKVFNLQYLFTFSFCGVTAYLVFRYLGVCYFFSSIGGILYGMSPYIYLRGCGHYSLAACYFIPLSILLCIFAIEDDEKYFSVKNGFKVFFSYKKNIAAIVFTILIANNGIGYYPFFTCFFLCITAMIKVFRGKKISALKPCVFPICLIVFFMLVALIPVFVYKISSGSNDVATRSLLDLEFYSLKPTQFFMPTNNHHIKFIRNLTAEYNSQAPLINENHTSYLGLFGCIGFILMMFLALVPENKKNSITSKLFPMLSLWAIVFFCIGGVTVYLCLLSGFRSLRGFNRVSIFIEFMAIATLCNGFQYVLDMFAKKECKLPLWGIRALIVLFSLFCIYEQHPSIRQNNDATGGGKAMREHDKTFVSQIENLLEENDAVYQLPYHKFPEAGPVGGMQDYSLFAGYLNSTKLRWSYGGMRGRQSDKWNERVSSLTMEKLIPVIVQSGFRGIYIDSRAYAKDELDLLRKNIEEVLADEKPLISENGQLYFYNLYPYLETHPELLNLPIFDVDYLPLQKNEVISLYGQHNARVFFASGLSAPEMQFTWTEGNKLVMQAALQKINNARPVHVKIDCNVFNGTQRVNAIINKTDRIELVAKDGFPLEFDFTPPQDGKLDLEFELPDAVSPKALGLSEDSRNLALALKSIVFTQEPDKNDK